MPKIKNVDAEEITSDVEEPVKQGFPPGSEALLEHVQRLEQGLTDQAKEINRLKAIADQTKGSVYDQENREKFKTGFLRHLGSPGDNEVTNPIVAFRCTKNVSYVDPKNSELIQDQRYEVTLYDGTTKELDIHEWNMYRDRQVRFKFRRMDHMNGVCDITLSTDGGQSYTGLEIDNLPMRFVNPG